MNILFVRFLSVTFVLVLFLAGCTSISIPTQENAETILVIPKQTKNSTIEEWVRKYKLEISQYGKVIKTVSVPASSDDFLLVDDLPAGKYQIEKYIEYIASFRWRPAGEAVRQWEHEVSPIEFELMQNQLTVLDSRFVVGQTTKGGFVYTEGLFMPLLRDQHKSLVDKIDSIDQSNWTIREPSYELLSKAQVNSALAERKSKLNQYIEALSKDEISESDWSGWMGQVKFDDEVSAMNDKEHYPAAIEGRYFEGVHQYRAVFRPYATGDFGWAANWGMPKKHYLNRNIRYIGQGYKRIWLQDYNGLDRHLSLNRDNYQAVWIRLGNE